MKKNKEEINCCKKYAAEFIGTAVLVLIGCGTAIFTNVNLVATALAFGLAVVAMAYTVGPISGGHFNPAVSTGALITQKIGWKDYLFYLLFQILGAIAASAILFGMVKLMGLTTGVAAAVGANGYAAAPDMTRAIVLTGIVEIVLTFIFVLTVLGVTSKTKNSKIAGMVIGLTLVMVHLMAITMLGGTSVNPARSIGPAIFGGVDTLKEVWAFIVFPLVGAVLAGLVALCLFNDDTADEPETITQAEPKVSKTASKTK